MADEAYYIEVLGEDDSGTGISQIGGYPDLQQSVDW